MNNTNIGKSFDFKMNLDFSTVNSFVIYDIEGHLSPVEGKIKSVRLKDQEYPENIKIKDIRETKKWDEKYKMINEFYDSLNNDSGSLRFKPPGIIENLNRIIQNFRMHAEKSALRREKGKFFLNVINKAKMKNREEEEEDDY